MANSKESLCPLRKRQIAREILAYLTEHPEAQDTLGGIVQWWLLERQIKYRIAEIRECLIDLRDKGLIYEIKSGDCQIHYRVNRKMLGEIQRMIKSDLFF